MHPSSPTSKIAALISTFISEATKGGAVNTLITQMAGAAQERNLLLQYFGLSA